MTTTANENLNIETLISDLEQFSKNPKSIPLERLEAYYNQQEKKLFIKVGGSEFNGSFPTSFAKSLVEIQDNFYKAVALGLYGKDDIRKLSKQDKLDYQFIFTTKEGSLEILGDVVKLGEFLERVVTGMTPEMKLFYLIFLTTALVGGYCFKNWYSKKKDTDLEVLRNNNQAEQNRELMRVCGSICKDSQDTSRKALAVAERMVANQELNQSSLAIGAKNADYLSINQNLLNRGDIEDLNKKADRKVSDTELKLLECYVIALNLKKEGVVKMTLVTKEYGEIIAKLELEDEDLFFNQEDQNRFWGAVENREWINLKLNILKSEDTVKESTILEIGNVVEQSTSLL